jgi:hypothetical protein
MKERCGQYFMKSLQKRIDLIRIYTLLGSDKLNGGGVMRERRGRRRRGGRKRLRWRGEEGEGKTCGLQDAVREWRARRRTYSCLFSSVTSTFLPFGIKSSHTFA